jgi:putative endonuclease
MAYSKSFTGYKRTLGERGEEYACKYLKFKGHKIFRRHLYNKYGEVDIVSIKDNVLYFFEVKTSLDGKVLPEDHFDWKKKRKATKLADFYYNQFMEEGIIPEGFDYKIQVFSITVSDTFKVVRVSILDI